MAGMDFEFHVGVSGIGELEAGAEAARNFEHALDGARDAELKLGASGVGAAAGLTAQTAAMDAATRSVSNLDQNGMARLNRRISEGAAIARDMETGVRDMGAGFEAARVHIDRGGSALRDVERGSRDAEKGLGGLEAAAAAATSSGGGLAALGGLVGPAALPAGIAALAGLAAGAVPAVLSLGAGFGAFAALAAPALLKVKTGLTDVTTAQAAYDTARTRAQIDPTKANLAAEQRALLSLKATWKQMPAPVADAVHEVQSLGKAWSQAGKKSGIQKAALGDIKGLARDAKDLIPTITKLATATAPIVHGAIADLGKEFKSKGFTDWVGNLVKEERPAARALKTIGSAAGGFITQLTAKEAKPGTAMLSSIGKLMKDITPGTVSGLTAATKGITGLINGLDAAANSKNVQQASSFMRGLTKDFQTFNKPGGGPVHMLNQGLDWLIGRKSKPVPIPVRPEFKVTPGSSAAALGLKGHALTVPVRTKIDGKDAASQVSKATAGKNIDVKGHVTLSGLGAGIQKQIAALHIPESHVKISVQVSGVGTAKSAMAGVVAAARQDAAGAKSALGSLGPAGAAAGGALDAGLAGGIKAGEGAVVAAARAVAGAAAAAVRSAAGIQSPSKVWKGLGKDMAAGLIIGLEGGKSQVDAVARLLTGAARPDGAITSTIRKMRKEIREAFQHNKITGGQEDALLNWVDIGNRRLQGLARQRAHLVAEIKAAQALSRSVRQGAIGYADITGIAGLTSAGQQAQANPPSAPASIQAGQKQDLHNIKAFTKDIRKLKKEGLDKQSIKELLNAGVSGGLPAAEQLLASGKKGVKESAKLQREIIAQSKKLGIEGANAAYESGSQIDKGLAAGLKAELGGVVKAIKDLARELINEMRKEMGLPPLPKGGGHGGGAHGGGHGHHHRHGPGHERYRPGGGDLFDTGGGGLQVRPGGGHGPIIVHLHTTTTLDGREVASSVQTRSLQRARRNVATGFKLANRGI